MTYEIKPQNIKTFIEDPSIKLPRFQRKQTWNDKKNFLLALSVFKGYPLGVCILNIENNGVNRSKWLLDGRQRRNAFTKMSEDPEIIYHWAKKYVGFKNTDQLHDIERLFEQKISEYIEDDIVDLNVVDEEVQDENDIFVDESNTILGIDLMLDIIKICHNVTSNGTGFTRYFNFNEYFDNLPFSVNRQGGGLKIDSRRLRYFILDYRLFCNLEYLKYDSQDSFVEFCRRKLIVKGASNLDRFKTDVKNNWNNILVRIEIVYNIETLLQQSEIGLIEVSNITSTDSQKIFNIINTGGSLLTAAEILSAKPVWNLKVKNPVEKTLVNKDILYKSIGVEFENVVRWDIPATVLKRFENMKIFIPDFDETAIERQINIGFKLLAGQFVGGIKKEDINTLGSNRIIEDVSYFEEYIQHMNNMLKIIGDASFFRFVKSWNKSMLDTLSEATTLNFLILMFENYKSLNYPISGTETKRIQVNAIILFDKMVYEYVKKMWRGSSDSKISRNLTNSNSAEIFQPIPKQKWVDLIKNILENNRIDDQYIDQGSITPLLYHYYYLSSISGPDIYDTIEVDHIIPKSLFDLSNIEDKTIIVNNLYNLQLLPKSLNCSKNSKKLNQIDNEWLKQQITKYSGITEEKFNQFSVLNDNTLGELRELRENSILSAFSIKRENILNNL